MLIARIHALDELLDSHAGQLGQDFTPYRNHAYRIANFCTVFSAAGPDEITQIGIAAAAHDIGIWTQRTFDYIEPSVLEARQHLVRSGREDWIPLITTMIREHHKLTRYRAAAGRLVEAFRRADWVDVSMGFRRFGLSRALLREAYTTWPSAGFHRRLVQLSLRELRAHPLKPLPMVKL